MTNKKINEFLAEHLFGLERGKDWGQQSNHNFVWYTADELGDEEGAYKCLLCEKYFAKEIDEVCYTKQPPDYIANYQQVLEKLLEAKNNKEYPFKCKITKADDNKFRAFLCMEDFDTPYSEGHDTIGEAICRATVEYLKIKEANR